MRERRGSLFAVCGVPCEYSAITVVVVVELEVVTEMCAKDPVSSHANELNPIPEAVEQAKACLETVLEHGPKIEIDHYLVYTTRASFPTHLIHYTRPVLLIGTTIR
jgi:hypothetical protein